MEHTITIRPDDNNLIIRNFDNEVAEVSGAVNLTCDWKLYKNMSDDKGIYTCNLERENIEAITGLRVDGVRAIRARYPS